ncbi:MAG: transcription factor S [Thermoproteota archaeon]
MVRGSIKIPMQIRFCPKCGTKLQIKREKGSLLYSCPKCNYEERAHTVEKSIETKRKTGAVRIIMKEADLNPLPVTSTVCPRCNNKEAYWWISQTRGADESATQFFKCTKCGYTWREYS